MGGRIKKNFEKRFGEPPRFNVIYPKKPLEGSERIYRNQKIADAVNKVLTGILDRKPTKGELIGRTRIDEAEFKACKAGKGCIVIVDGGSSGITKNFCRF